MKCMVKFRGFGKERTFDQVNLICSLSLCYNVLILPAAQKVHTLSNDMPWLVLIYRREKKLSDVNI